MLIVLRAPASALRSDQAAALALVHAVGAVAHGYAAFLHKGVLPAGPEAVVDVEDGARSAARALANLRA